VCLGNNAIERAGLVAAVERAADGIVITDVTGTIRYVNPAFTALTGYAKEEAVGQSPRILKSGQMPAAGYEKLWSTIRSGGVWQGGAGGPIPGVYAGSPVWGQRSPDRFDRSGAQQP
jgi:PAS domain-containing protein